MKLVNLGRKPFPESSWRAQQNGVSEKKNRSIMEMARCMLYQKQLPKKFWAEAANTVVFIQNRIPTRVIQN